MCRDRVKVPDMKLKLGHSVVTGTGEIANAPNTYFATIPDKYTLEKSKDLHPETFTAIEDFSR